VCERAKRGAVRRPDMNALLGALVGDAAGATLEFLGARPITEEMVAHAMKMPGGGRGHVGPGSLLSADPYRDESPRARV
jgi:hypothetical protein